MAEVVKAKATDSRSLANVAKASADVFASERIPLRVEEETTLLIPAQSPEQRSQGGIERNAFGLPLVAFPFGLTRKKQIASEIRLRSEADATHEVCEARVGAQRVKGRRGYMLLF